MRSRTTTTTTTMMAMTAPWARPLEAAAAAAAAELVADGVALVELGFVLEAELEVGVDVAELAALMADAAPAAWEMNWFNGLPEVSWPATRTALAAAMAAGRKMRAAMLTGRGYQQPRRDY